MTVQMRPRVKYVIGPDGSPLTIADLPPKNTRRWVIRRKAEVVAAVRGGLPIQEFVHAKRIACTSLFETQQPSTHRGNDLGFSPDHPTPGVLGRKIRDRQRASIRPDNVLDAGTHLYGHFTLYLT